MGQITLLITPCYFTYLPCDCVYSTPVLGNLQGKDYCDYQDKL